MRESNGLQSDAECARLLLETYFEHMRCKAINEVVEKSSVSLNSQSIEVLGTKTCPGGSFNDRHEGPSDTDSVDTVEAAGNAQPEDNVIEYIVKTEPVDDDYEKHSVAPGARPEYKDPEDCFDQEGCENPRDLADKIAEFMQKDKTIKVKEDNSSGDKRRSLRMRQKGFRINYAAVEWDDGSSTEDDNLDVSQHKVKNDSEKSEDSETDSAVGLESKVAESTDLAEQKTEKVKHKSQRKQRKSHASDDDLDFKLTEEETNADRFESSQNPESSNARDKETEKVKHKGQRKKRKSDASDEDPDFKLTDEESCGERPEGTASKAEHSRGNKCKKKTKHAHESAREKKPWIKIKLEDHPDKFEKERMESFQQQHRNSDVNEEMYSCLVCKQFKCASRDAFESHIELHVNRYLECDKCQYSSFNRRDLSSHLYECYGKPSHICDLCGELSRSKSALRNHLGRVHDIPRWKCNYCKEMFVTQSRQRSHVKEVHPEHYRFCPFCFRVQDVNQEDYEKHLESCKEKKPCEICGELLLQKNISKHMRTNHLNIRQYHCTHCSYIAKFKSTLDKHLLTHTGEHPYRCDQCTFSSAQAFNLKYHMRTHSGDKPFKCTQCSYSATWNVQLKDHVKVHSMEGTKLCEECNILFKNERLFGTHMKKVHQ